MRAWIFMNSLQILVLLGEHGEAFAVRYEAVHLELARKQFLAVESQQEVFWGQISV